MKERILKGARALGYISLLYFLWGFRADFYSFRHLSPAALVLLVCSALSYLLYTAWLQVIGGILGTEKNIAEMSAHSALLEQALPKGGLAVKLGYFTVGAENRLHPILLLGYPVVWNLVFSLYLALTAFPLPPIFLWLSPALFLAPSAYLIVCEALGLKVKTWAWTGALLTFLNFALGTFAFALAVHFLLPESALKEALGLHAMSVALSFGGIFSSIPGAREALLVLSARLTQGPAGPIFLATLLLRLCDAIALGTIAIYFSLRRR